MTAGTDEVYINRCRLLIETRLGRGASETWNNHDFEELSVAIHETTGVRLSVTTLKRIWGKLKYESAPTITTLNALAQFAGYHDWRKLTEQKDLAHADLTKAAEEPLFRKAKKKPNALWLMLLAIIPVTAYIFEFPKYSVTSEKPDPDKFEFKADKMITEGVPNSVVFHYDARNAKTDSVFIVQTWDARRKKLVDKNKHEHSAIYYYPGFFRTKLLADGHVVKTHDLWITSGGWLGLIEALPSPVYLKKSDYLKSDRVEIDKSTLRNYAHADSKTPRVRFFNQQDMGDLMDDNFTFETEVKNDFDDGSNACHKVEILIQGKDEVIIIPLTAKSCIGELSLFFAGARADSKDTDLSKFGCDLTQWTKLRIDVVDRMATISINGVVSWSQRIPNEPAGIVGVQYRFIGAGAVRNTWLSSRGKLYDFKLK